MAKQDERFEVVSTEGGWSTPSRTVLLDTVTGVQYLFVQNGNGAACAPFWTKTANP